MKDKNLQSGFGVLMIVIIIGLLALSSLVYITLNRINSADEGSIDTTQNYQENTPENNTNPSVIQGVEITPEAWYFTELENGEQFYGKLQRISSEFVLLSPVFYKDTNSGRTVIKSLGNELHGPENAIFIADSGIATIEERAPSSAEVQAYLEDPNSQNEPLQMAQSEVIESYVKSENYQALYFNDGQIYYTKIETLKNDSIKLGFSVYSLSQGGGQSVQLSLKLLAADEVKTYSLNDLIYWQNLKLDGQITQSIETFTSAQ